MLNGNYRRWRVLAWVVLASALVCAGPLSAQAPNASNGANAGNATKAPNVPGAPGQAPGENPPAAKVQQEVPLQNTGPYREVIDGAGRTVRLPQPVERMVSLAPNLTETIYALGLQDHLVGDTDYCDYPPAAQKKPKVGGTINPSIEQVAALRPDVVLMASINRFETVRALDDLKIPVYETDPHNVREIITSITKLADALGVPQTGMELAGELQQRLADLQQRLDDLPAKRVLFVVWTEPLISIGRNTFIADALRKAGAVSIVDTEQDWPKVSLEEIVRLQPEFLVFTEQNDEKAPDLLALGALPGWRSLDAVRNHRFIIVSDAVNRPAPRIVSAIEGMARQLHPEAFLERPNVAAPVNKDNVEKPNAVPQKVPPSQSAQFVNAAACTGVEALACNR